MIYNCLFLAALVSPLLLYAGGAAVSLPIIIHLLAKKRFKRIRWAAIDFLLLAEKQNRRKINLRQLILLALRCLAVFLLGLMLARPYLTPGGVASLLGSSPAQQKIFILDDSFSMSFKSGSSSTFDQAREMLDALLSWSARQAPHARIRIFKTSDPDHPVYDRALQTDADLLEVKATLAALLPTTLPASFGDFMVRMADDLASDDQRLDTALFIVSDFQKSDWLALGGSETPLAVFADWDQSARTAGRKLAIRLVQTGEQARPNLAITGLEATQPRTVATVESRMVATITNFSSRACEPFELVIYVDDAAQPAVAVPAIEAGDSVTVAFDHVFEEVGFRRVRVEIPTDSLPLDDARTTSRLVQSGINVVVVNGEPSSRALDDEVALLQTALHPEGEVFSGFSVAEIDESEINAAALDAVQVLMLANVYRLSDDKITTIEDFVRSGGGLVIFLGDQVEAGDYNERLWKNGAGLLPCQLGQVLEVAEGQAGVTLAEGDRPHPIVSVFRGERNPFLSNLSFWRYFECIADGEAGETQSDAQRDARVVARYTDEHRLPAIVEKSFGLGRVILFASSADVEWNNWPRRPSYVVAMQELGHYATGPDMTHADIITGSAIRLSLDADRYQPQVVVRTPAYPSESEVVLQAEVGWVSTHHSTAGVVAGGFRPTLQDFTLPAADQVGVYQVTMTRSDGRTEQRQLAANPDPAESNLASCSETELRGSAGSVEFDFISDVSTLSEGLDEPLHEYWPALLLAIVALLMVEQTLACWFGRSS